MRRPTYRLVLLARTRSLALLPRVRYGLPGAARPTLDTPGLGRITMAAILVVVAVCIAVSLAAIVASQGLKS